MSDYTKRMVEALRDHAEWAKGNEWETPITLSDDLIRAADLIETLALERDKWKRQAERADREKDALFYENARLRSR